MITVSKLSKVFPSSEGRPVEAVRDVSFDVGSGEVFGLLGPNGAGKTTTLRMMLGLMQPTSGDSTIDKVSVARHPDRIKRRVGFVSTSVGVYQWLTPREMLSFVADLYDVPPVVAEERVDHLADLLDLHSYLNRRCGVLSTGQKQRVNLARALIHDPPVMFLDEPTRGLDIVGSQVVFEFIQHLREEGKAVIICTHRLDEAERFADRFGLLHEGTLLHCGTLADLQRETGEPTLTQMFIRLLNQPTEASP
ncbi:MAG: ATP-binding cassette domain-containing protein [Fuerstiella sp.]